MDMKGFDEAGVDVRFTWDEVRLVNGALNEICNGIHLADSSFVIRLGQTREAGLALLDEVHGLFDVGKTDDELRQKLRRWEVRNQQAIERYQAKLDETAAEARSWLNSLGIGIKQEITDWDLTAEDWSQYLKGLRASAPWAKHWPAAEVDEVRTQLQVAATAVLGANSVFWVPSVAEHMVGFVVPTAPIVDAAMEHLVTRQADLFLCAEDSYAGLCLELNESPGGFEYELSAWDRGVTHGRTRPRPELDV